MSSKAFKDFEESGWSGQAPTYGELTGAITRRIAASLLDDAGVGTGSRLLDVATGPGYVSEAALARGASVVAIDIADGMLEQARARLPGAEVLRADAEALPFDDASFDALVGGCVLNHLPRAERALAEGARVLHPGGRAAFSVWDRPERMRAFGVVSDAITAAGVESDGAIPDGAPDPYRFADDAELERALGAAGLADAGVRTVELVHEVAGPAELWRGFLGSSVRTAAVVRAQDEPTRRRILEQLERRVEPYRGEDGRLELPVVAKIGAGRRP